MKLRQVPIVQLGLGGVGRALVRQVIANRQRHAQQLGVSLSYRAIADRDGLVLDDAGLEDTVLEQLCDAKAQGKHLRELTQGHPWDGSPDPVLDVCRDPHTVIVDVTATAATVPVLRAARRRDCKIVLANKLPLAGPWELFHELTSSRKTRFETTVGAALPVISTLQSFLLDTGDEVRKIRGCLSGTLNIICQRLERGERFSHIVREARARGHTEPDPREDLAGRDVARKALILARLLGYPLELEHVQKESLYPSQMDALPLEEFLERRLGDQDSLWQERAHQVHARGHQLRYVIEVSQGRCQAKLEELSPDDALLRPGTADSVVIFYTERYRDGLIIRGKGSGPELTASGVLADILLL